MGHLIAIRRINKSMSGKLSIQAPEGPRSLGVLIDVEEGLFGNRLHGIREKVASVKR